ncbi:MAG: N-acetylmuramoyl-L-alanine amidase [Gordonia sp. (in: high G+C Gram-positive bacteria)]|uniref:N-acetylmuramoyl-L-alanine amidase n=1 Tax=Gordonia sp. (in: high G+C Gram-positive bacteria) TaxID=84139 RepID=UPI0039E571FF
MSVVSVRRAALAAASVLFATALTVAVVPAASAAPAAPAAPATPTTPAAPASPTAPAATPLQGKTVFLDPGHQGSATPAQLSKQVPDGRGGTKDCQTTGATGVNGVTEHEINWKVAQLVKASLESEGARVLLSRPDDKNFAGCVDERAERANRSNADVAVSIHADSTSNGVDNGKSGFHLIVPKLPVLDQKVNTVQGGQGLQATEKMRDALTKAGLHTANYAGVVDGIQTRSDLTGPNITTVPLVFIEMGNLSNQAEAKTLSSPTGAAKYAGAITNGLNDYLGAPATTTAGTATDGIDDLSGLADVGPLIEQLSKAKSLGEAQQILTSQGADVSSQIVKAMLAVIYAVFGGKLPV